MDIVVYQFIDILSRRLELHRRFFYYPHNFTVDSQLIIVSGTALKIISAMATFSNASIFGGTSSVVFTKRKFIVTAPIWAPRFTRTLLDITFFR